MANSYRPGFEKFDWLIASLGNPIQDTGCPTGILVHTVSCKNTQMRFEQCDSWKAIQIISRRPICTCLSQQFEGVNVMKIRRSAKREVDE